MNPPSVTDFWNALTPAQRECIRAGARRSRTEVGVWTPPLEIADVITPRAVSATVKDECQRYYFRCAFDAEMTIEGTTDLMRGWVPVE